MGAAGSREREVPEADARHRPVRPQRRPAPAGGSAAAGSAHGAATVWSPRAEAQLPRQVRGRRDDDASAILRLLGRFGAATVNQLARHLKRRPAAVQQDVEALMARRLVRVSGPTGTASEPALCATPAGLRRLPALAPKPRVSARRIEALLAAVDAAWLVASRGDGRWVTWPEAVRDGQVLVAGEGAPAADGLIVRGPDVEAARGVPACLVLRRPSRSALLERLAAAGHAAASAEVWVFAPARLCAELARQVDGMAATVIPLPAAPPRGRGRRAAVTPKRQRALRFLGTHGYATVDQVARAQGTRSTAASIMLAALEKQGLVQRHREHHLHKDVYSATEAGLGAAGLALPALPRLPVQRRHALALVDLADMLTHETGGVWSTQREVVPLLARRTDLAGVSAPDGLLTLPDGRRVAVELDLSSQPRHAVLRFIDRHLAAGTCDEVWYLVSPEWEGRYRSRLTEVPRTRVRAWTPPDRLGGPRGFRATRPTREPAGPRILGRGRRRPE